MTDVLMELAKRQWHDYIARRPGTCFAEPGFVLDLREAYELQRAVCGLRIASGDTIVGYKVGCTGAGTIAQFGMEGPIRGILYQSEVRRSGDRLDAAAFAGLAIEGEMALRIGGDGEVEAAFPVIELHHFVFRAARRTLAELVANNGLNGGIVLPAPPYLSSRRYLRQNATLSVAVDGRVIDSSGLWPLAGGAAASLAWLRGHLAQHGLALSPGQVVLAGTPLGLYPVAAGEHVVVSIDGNPAVECLVG